MVHYPALIRPERTRSARLSRNRNISAGQMLMTNQRSDNLKLAAARIDFTERGMLQGDLLDDVLDDLRELLYIPVLTI
jgi:hypothetical protein